jgi:hypothetical protein
MKVMDKQLALKISVANPTCGFEVSEVYDELENELLNAEVYRLESTKVTFVAIEFVAILGDVGSVASIAAFLFYIYDTRIRPKKRNQKDTCGLYIAIDPENGLQWWLGKDFLNKTEFIKDFTMKVEKYLNTDRSGTVYEQIKVEVSGKDWIRRK